MDFTDKVVLVTGASSGIGEDAAINFAKAGAKVALVGRNEIRLNGVADKIKNNGSAVPLIIIADVTKDAQKIIDQTIQNFGKLNILINNAGIGGRQSASTIDLEQYDSIFATNVRAVVELTKLAAPHLEQSKGNIINISSIAGLHPFKEAVHYCMSKAALDMYTKCASLELAPKGVRVNSVNPGMIDTSFFQAIGITQNQIEEIFEKAKDIYPVGRTGVVSDTTNAILFLASDRASFINGVLLPVDGGKLNV